MAKKRAASVRRGSGLAARPKSAGEPTASEAPNIPPSIGYLGPSSGLPEYTNGHSPGYGLTASSRSVLVGGTRTKPLLPLQSEGNTAADEPNGSRLARGLSNLLHELDAAQPRPDTAAWDRAVKEAVDRELYENSLPEDERVAKRINRALSQQPADIRDSMRALSLEFNAQIDELKARWPNDQDGSDSYSNLLALFEKMAKGLSDLADALDAVIENASDGKTEPVFLGKAGEIARGLQRFLMKWVDESDTKVIERPVKITLYSLAIAFLNSIGADSAAAIAGLTAIVLNKSTPSTGKNGKRRRSRRPE
jgi:hypothetical protein